jgi:hypothetical protein
MLLAKDRTFRIAFYIRVYKLKKSNFLTYIL